MKKIINITLCRKQLLKIVDNLKLGKGTILSKDNIPKAVLISLEEYERTVDKTKPVLIIVAAKKCKNEIINKSISQINKTLLSNNNPFSKVIFVYSSDTEYLIKKIKCPDIYIIENEKFNQPLITSLKSAMSGLTDEKYFIITFLSRITTKNELIKIAETARKSVKGIIIPLKNDKPSHPIAFASIYKKYILSIRKEYGIPYLIKKFKTDIYYLK